MMRYHEVFLTCATRGLAIVTLVGACQSGVGGMEDTGSGGRPSGGGHAGSGGREGSGGRNGSGGRSYGGSSGGVGTGGVVNRGGAIEDRATGGKAGAGGTTGSSGACPAATNVTMAVHTIVDVTWPATLGASGGSGKFHIWSMDKLTVDSDGTTISGKTFPCGSTVPEISLTSIVGGGKVEIDVPMSFWDIQPALEFAVSGAASEWAPGGTITQSGEPALVGLTMTDPNASWPASYTSVQPVDVDKDGKSALTAVPRSGSGYVNPPLSVIGAMGPRADRVDVVNRTAIDISGSFTSCTEHSGKATAKYLDNHVVGCHVTGSSECNASQVKFLDDNRTAYVIKDGSYVAKMVSDNATCTDVRAALPE